MDVLDVENVSVTAADKLLLNHINFRAVAGEILAIVGPNGAGKTTLVNAISGGVPLASGSITLCGKNSDAWVAKDRARHVAVLPQLSLLNFPYTVKEVVSLGRIPHATGHEVDQKIVRQSMLAMDIVHLCDRIYTQLSGGEKQRTQLARVMTQIWREEDASARLLILDEPCAALDLGHQQQLMRAIVDFAAQGVAVLMVLHDVNVASRYAHMMMALKAGKIMSFGEVESIVNTALLRDLFEAELDVLTHPISKKTIVV